MKDFSLYVLSKDYNKLYQLLCEGKTIVGLVDYQFKSLEGKYPPSRDICLIERKKEFDISFSIRGFGYGGVESYWQGREDEIVVFLSECKSMNLEWITPHDEKIEQI